MDYETSNRLYELRKSRGYSQDELADMLGVSRQAISKWERGESSPDTDNLIALARLYGVSLDELVGYVPTNKINDEKESADDTDEVFSDVDDAFHVKNDDGSEVFIDGEKIRVIDDKGKRIEISGGPARIAKTVIDKVGVHVKTDFVDDENDTLHTENHHINSQKVKIHSPARKVADAVVPVLVLVAYLLLGFLGGWWHPAWLVFFAIPIFFCAWDAFSDKKLSAFPVPFIVLAVYLALGIVLHAWHPYWALFFIIPAYFCISAPLDKHFVEKRKSQND